MSAPMDEEDLLESDNYYAWLGIHKDATPEEINNAFRKMSRVFHPDKHAGNQEAVQNAEVLFTKIKKAHAVLSDPHQKAIYDTMGVKGLNTEGWQVVPRTKSPREILEEYERLQAEKQEQKLQQRTNPRGNISVGIDATDIFDRYEAYDALEYSPLFPHIEVTQMSISQSVDCPLTTKDTAVIAGNISVDNGNGSGNISTTFRRVMSHRSWAEAEVSAGSGIGLGLRGFRTLWSRAYGTMSGTCQITSKGLKPLYSAMIAQQLDKNVQGRMTFTLGSRHSSLQTVLAWDNERNHVAFIAQLGLPNSFLVLNFTHNVPDYDLKLRARLKVGTLSMVGEYGCEKKITQFSSLGATMTIGVPNGVVLHIKLHRGNQNFTFPIHLSEGIAPEPIIYGTVVPLLVYAAIKGLLVSPFLKDQKEQELQRKKEANMRRFEEKRKEAEAAIDLMKETVDRSYEIENKKGGLIIKKALYGKLHGDNIDNEECINVTKPLQALVKDSKMVLPEATQLNELPGFYDPCIGEEKHISITYLFRVQLHVCSFTEGEKILIPHKDHLCEVPPDDG